MQRCRVSVGHLEFPSNLEIKVSGRLLKSGRGWPLAKSITNMMRIVGKRGAGAGVGAGMLRGGGGSFVSSSHSFKDSKFQRSTNSMSCF